MIEIVLIDVLMLLLFSLVVMNYKHINLDYLDTTNTNYLRGFFALFIIFHHISQRISQSEIFDNFLFVGEYAVAFFFFLSAYSLVSQYKKQENYMSNFLQKRLTKLFIPYILFSGLYFLFWYFIYDKYHTKEELLSIITDHESIIISGWFLQGIIVMYITFYLSFRFVKSIKVAACLNLLLVVLIISIMMYLEIGYWEYNSLLAFPFGIFWGIYKEKIDKLMQDKYKILLIIFTILLYVGHNYIDFLMAFEIKDYVYNYGFLANIKNIIFVIFFILLALKLDFRNKFFNFLGNISLELYLIHGMFIYYLPDILGGDKKDDFVYASLVIILSIISAYILNKIITRIQKIRS